MISWLKLAINRNFIRGLMDGSLTTLGTLIASLRNPEILAAVGLGVAVANSISNACGGYVSEKSAKITTHNKFEKAMLIDRGLAKTVHMTKAEKSSLIRGLWDSMGTFVGAMIPVSCVLLIPWPLGIVLGTVIPVLCYIGLGIWMSMLSREHVIISVMKTTLFALGTVGICYLINLYI